MRILSGGFIACAFGRQHPLQAVFVAKLTFRALAKVQSSNKHTHPDAPRSRPGARRAGASRHACRPCKMACCPRITFWIWASDGPCAHAVRNAFGGMAGRGDEHTRGSSATVGQRRDGAQATTRRVTAAKYSRGSAAGQQGAPPTQVPQIVRVLETNSSKTRAGV